MRKLIIPLLIFMLISAILCGCDKIQKNTCSGIANSAAKNSSAAIKQEGFKQTESLAFNEKVQEFTTKLAPFKNDCKKTCFIGLNKKYYFFYSYDDKYAYYFTINRGNGSLNMFYKLSNAYDIFFEREYENIFLIGYGDWGNYDTCHFHLVSVTPEGKEKLLLKCDMRGYPACSLTGHYLIMNYVESSIISSGKTAEKGNAKVTAVDLENGNKKGILTTSFKRDNPTYSGTVIPDSQGWKDGSGFCYEKVDMSNESYEKDGSGKCAVYYYSFKGGTSKKLTDVPHKVLYIRGDDDCFVTSDYLLQSNDISGRITLNENGTYRSYDIPGIFSGEDVLNSFKLSGKYILVYNDSHFLIYNLADRTYYTEKFKYSKEGDHYYALNIQADGDEFAYTQPDKNNIIIHLFTLKSAS